MQLQWLNEYRDKKGLTQEQVADLAKISRPYYTMIEKGKRRPGVNVAKRIANVLNFKWAIFFTQNGNETLLKNQQPAWKEVNGRR